MLNKLNRRSVVRSDRKGGRKPDWSPRWRRRGRRRSRVTKVCEISLTGTSSVDHWLVTSPSFLGNEVV